MHAGVTHEEEAHDRLVARNVAEDQVAERRPVPPAPYALLRLEPKRVRNVDRVALGEAVEVEPAREADGIFLRKTPDRTYRCTPESRRCGPLLCLAARVSPRLVVRTARDPRRVFSKGSAGGDPALLPSTHYAALERIRIGSFSWSARKSRRAGCKALRSRQDGIDRIAELVKGRRKENVRQTH